MIGKLKKILGIEGVKLSLELSEQIMQEEGVISGNILLSTMNPSTIESVDVKILERYQRGRGDRQKIDEYTIASLVITEPIILEKDEAKRVAFSLPYKKVDSPIDKFGSRNFLFKGLSTLAKWRNKVQSTYRIEATAQVEGTSLNPKDSFTFGSKEEADK